MERAFRAAKDMHLAIRGLHGEGTEATGDLYQVSNQTTLGKSEDEIISEFKHVIIPKLVEYERRARQALIRERPVALDDKIWRAYGLLTNARAISTEEALFLLSHLRMGVSLGRIERIKLESLNDLFLMIQPAHLQKMAGKRLAGEERSIVRADLIRKKLGGVSPNGL
jgi:protein arginine kinase